MELRQQFRTRDCEVTNGPEINYGEQNNNHQELWVYCQLKGKNGKIAHVSYLRTTLILNYITVSTERFFLLLIFYSIKHSYFLFFYPPNISGEVGGETAMLPGHLSSRTKTIIS